MICYTAIGIQTKTYVGPLHYEIVLVKTLKTDQLIIIEKACMTWYKMFNAFSFHVLV